MVPAAGLYFGAGSSGRLLSEAEADGREDCEKRN